MNKIKTKNKLTFLPLLKNLTKKFKSHRKTCNNVLKLVKLNKQQQEISIFPYLNMVQFHAQYYSYSLSSMITYF